MYKYVPSDSESKLCCVMEVSRQAGGGLSFMTSSPTSSTASKKSRGEAREGYYTDLRTQHASEEEGGGGSRAGIFIKICINRLILCRFQPFLRRSFILISLMSGPLKI